jgi:hypothetical protein
MYVVDRDGNSFYEELEEEDVEQQAVQALPVPPPPPRPQTAPASASLPPLPLELAPRREQAAAHAPRQKAAPPLPPQRSAGRAPKGHASVELPFAEPPTRITLDHGGQHTLEWSTPISFGGTTLEPGKCLLYTYPSGVEGAAQLALLEKVVAHLAATHLFELPDAVGAYPIHAILVCNTAASLRTSFACLDANPRLLLQVHSNDGPFAGESALHIMAANRRDDEACWMVDLALAHFDEADVRLLLTTQAHGPFFEDAPMRWYGESPLSYACVFGCRRVARKMLDTGLVRFDANPGILLGFYPLHAVVASGSRLMYDWMTRELPPTLRADGELLSHVGRLASIYIDHMSGMQVACKRGLRAMFQHILRRDHVTVLWKWGPVAAYELDLSGIDSSGDGAADVMEIVARRDASRVTTTFLLDDFMQVTLGL